jgi:hypothetical protein
MYMDVLVLRVRRFFALLDGDVEANLHRGSFGSSDPHPALPEKGTQGHVSRGEREEPGSDSYYY